MLGRSSVGVGREMMLWDRALREGVWGDFGAFFTAAGGRFGGGWRRGGGGGCARGGR